tara:strand:+ start:611 stop:979 length:369 start_codon:yes stop_codon:yes gene_type:complete
MRLYTNRHGSWVGTQADARKQFGFKNEWREVDVPTDKPNLLQFLNTYAVGGEKVEPIVADTPRTAPRAHGQSCSGNREVREAAALNRYDVRDVVLNCPKEYLGGALSAITTRIYDMEDELNA